MGQPITILVLTASPSDKALLAVYREARAIDERLRASTHRDCFRIEKAQAVRASDLSALLQRYNPEIVHFSGHGGDEGELLLEDEDGEAKPVTKEAIGELFRVLGNGVRCVVLNACYSEAQAEMIAQHIDCVIGMTGAIEDATSVMFAKGFYQALGSAHNVQKAFEAGCLEIGLRGGAGPKEPKLHPPDGLKASQINFVEIAKSGSRVSVGRAEDASGASGGKSETDPLAHDLAALRAEIVAELKAEMEKRSEVSSTLAGALADQLSIPDRSSHLAENVAGALVETLAKDIAAIFDDLDITDDPQRRKLVRRLLWRAIPFAPDQRKHVLQARQSLSGGANVVALELRLETSAEIVLAGADARPARFAPDGPYPQGVARVPLPPEALTAFFDRKGDVAVDSVVQHIVREKDQGGDRDWSGLLGKHANPDELRVTVNQRLKYAAGKKGSERLPHYLLLIDAELNKDTNKDIDQLWSVAGEAFGKKLPSLRLVRLKGGVDELENEVDVAEPLRIVRNRQ